MSTYRWSTEWRDLTTDDRKELVAAIPVLVKLTGVLERRLQANTAAGEKLEGYANPNWAYQQADYIATQRTLKDVIKLITPSDVNNT